MTRTEKVPVTSSPPCTGHLNSAYWTQGSHFSSSPSPSPTAATEVRCPPAPWPGFPSRAIPALHTTALVHEPREQGARPHRGRPLGTAAQADAARSRQPAGPDPGRVTVGSAGGVTTDGPLERRRPEDQTDGLPRVCHPLCSPITGHTCPPRAGCEKAPRESAHSATPPGRAFSSCGPAPLRPAGGASRHSGSRSTLLRSSVCVSVPEFSSGKQAARLHALGLPALRVPCSRPGSSGRDGRSPVTQMPRFLL